MKLEYSQDLIVNWVLLCSFAFYLFFYCTVLKICSLFSIIVQHRDNHIFISTNLPIIKASFCFKDSFKI